MPDINIDHINKLANLNLSPAELEKYKPQLVSILDYINQLSEAQTDSVTPLYNVTDNKFVLTQPTNDEVENSLTQAESLQNAPQATQGMFVTKGVFQKE